MARVSLDKDRELTKFNLLRVSVVADLLGVAPKTVNAWLNSTHTKVRGIKYLDWSVVRAQRANDVYVLGLPIECSDAYVLWEAQKVMYPEPKPLKPGVLAAVIAAQSTLNKAMALLPHKSVPVTATKPVTIEQLPAIDASESQIVLTVPVMKEEILTIPPEYKRVNAGIAVKKIAGDVCNACEHSLELFHSVIGCNFAKSTVAACKCKKGVS